MEKNVGKYKVKESNISKLKEYLSNNTQSKDNYFSDAKNTHKK